MFGRNTQNVVEAPVEQKQIEPYAEVKRISLWRWRIGIERGKDDAIRTRGERHYGQYYSDNDPIKYFRSYYYAFSEKAANEKAKRLLSRAKNQIDWSRVVKRFDVE